MYLLTTKPLEFTAMIKYYQQPHTTHVCVYGLPGTSGVFPQIVLNWNLACSSSWAVPSCDVLALTLGSLGSFLFWWERQKRSRFRPRLHQSRSFQNCIFVTRIPALNHSGERFPKDAVLMSVFTGFVWREGPFVFKNTQFSQNYPDLSWPGLRLGNNDSIVQFFAVTTKLQCDFTFYRECKQTTTNFSLSFWTWKFFLGIQFKFKLTRGHCFRDVFPAVAVCFLRPGLLVAGYFWKRRLFFRLYASRGSVLESFSPVHTITLKRWKYDHMP